MHEWLGCEEVNDWYVASCSCGWTYQHPNYGSDQESFVNHWGDHITAELREALASQSKQGTFDDGWDAGLEAASERLHLELPGLQGKIRQLKRTPPEETK